MTEYFKIGKLVAPFGLKGEVILQHSLGKKTAFKGLTALFLEEGKERFIPYFLTEARVKNNEETYLKFQGIDTREATTTITRREAWLAEPDFKKFSAKTSPINLLGFEVIENGKTLGTILEVIEQPHQVLCRIEMEGKEVLIPLHEGTLVKTDNRKKQVTVELPEGLLEIYLS